MTDQTRQTLTILLAADPTIGPTRAAEMLQKMTDPAGASDPVRLIARPKQAAAALGCSVRTVANYAARGLIQPVKLTGSRASGYRWSDIRKLAGC